MTGPRLSTDPQLRFWHDAFSGADYYYGHEPGPVARRAVRYHRPHVVAGGTALDAGCGEGQDLAFLVERGYRVTGLDFAPSAIEKAERMLGEAGASAELVHADLRRIDEAGGPLADRRFDLVLAVNSIQFMGGDGRPALLALRERVAPGGVIGLSLFGREAGQPELAETCWFTTLPELLELFAGWQVREAAQLWQWSPHPQAFVTLIARRRPSPRGELAFVPAGWETGEGPRPPGRPSAGR